MKLFGIVNWGDAVMRAVHAEDRSEACKKLEARGFTGYIIEIVDIEQAPTSSPRSSVPPPRGPTHWENARNILVTSREGVKK